MLFSRDVGCDNEGCRHGSLLSPPVMDGACVLKLEW